MAELFGRYCYIDTPWIAGKKTRYRIIGSGVCSNAWFEVPVTGRSELIRHDNMEEIVFVVLDTMVGEDSIIRRFAIKDIEVIPADVRPVVRGKWVPEPDRHYHWHCSECGYTVGVVRMDCKYCPNCGSYNGADMRGGDAE